MSRHSLTQVHAEGIARNPSVQLIHHPDDMYVVTIHAGLVTYEAFDSGERLIAGRSQSDPTVHLYLTIEQAVTMATDILHASMGKRSPDPIEIRRTA